MQRNTTVDGPPKPIQRRRPRTQNQSQSRKRGRSEENESQLTAASLSLILPGNQASAPLSLPKEPSKLLSGTDPGTNSRTPESFTTTAVVSPPAPTYNFANNKLVLSKSRIWMTVHDPATQRLLSRVPDSTLEEVQNTVFQADVAQKLWSMVPFNKRRAKMLGLLEIIRDDSSIIAACITSEVGKTIDDAASEVTRALDMIEAACSIQNGNVGSYLADDATSTHTIHEPLGICMTVSPFNFPLLVGLWSIPFAIITGNSVVWKPSEKCPGAAMLLADCFRRAGFPPGVLSIVHGGPSVVNKLLSQPLIKAVSFVGSDIAGEQVHAHAIATRKRVQADLGSKNHGVIIEDALKERSLYSIAGSAFGAAGQRCMALSVAVFVGSTSSWIPDLVRIASSMKVGCGSDPGVALGPLITSASKQRVEAIIERAVDEGATLLLDGRNVIVPEYPSGNFIGPTILSDVQPYMACYQTEIFAPVLCCIQVGTFDEAVEIVNENRYGNGCTIFTQSPYVAEMFERKVNVGQIGINVPVLASPGQLLRSSNKDSYLGHKNLPGQSSWQFFTMTKTITSLWRGA